MGAVRMHVPAECVRTSDLHPTLAFVEQNSCLPCTNPSAHAVPRTTSSSVMMHVVKTSNKSGIWHSEIVVRIHALALPACSPRRGHLRGGIMLGSLLRGLRVC